MNKYLNILLAAGILVPATVSAQNVIDALRFGQTNGAATARALGLGGAGGSYGADFSSLSINPAGIGVYRKSELMITPSLRFNGTKGTYLNNTVTDNNTKINLNNFGVVFSTATKGKSYQSSAWKAFSIGIGYNRIADFNNRGIYSGLNTESSMSEAFAADAIVNGVGQNMVPPFGYFGYEGYLMDDAGNSIPYENIIRNGGALEQKKAWESSGGINEWTLSVGGNYMEKLMLGAAVGLTSYSYDRTNTYSEDDASGNLNNDFAYFDYNEYLSTTGIGVNVKLGAIYVIDNNFRIGAAFHTPTWSAFSDISDYAFTSNTEQLNGLTNLQPSNEYQFDYSLRTPWRGVLSATAFMGRHGFVTADYEYAAVNSMRYSFANNSFDDYERRVNDAIKETYRGTHNIRLGVEGRADKFLGRVGFAYRTSPFNKSDLFDGQRLDLSAGIGLRVKGFFMDLAYVHTIQKSAEYGYPLLVESNSGMGIRKIPVGIANIRNGNNMIALTIGFKFGSNDNNNMN